MRFVSALPLFAPAAAISTQWASMQSSLTISNSSRYTRAQAACDAKAASVPGAGCCAGCAMVDACIFAQGTCAYPDKPSGCYCDVQVYCDCMEAAVFDFGSVCSSEHCTSPDGADGNDCWAGSEREGCSCSVGVARELHTNTIDYRGDTYYEYSCCKGGENQGRVCYDFEKTRGPTAGVILAIIFTIVAFCCICGCIGVSIFLALNAGQQRQRARHTHVFPAHHHAAAAASDLLGGAIITGRPKPRIEMRTMQGYVQPQQAAPVHGYAAMPQHGSPQRGYAQPHQGYAQPEQIGYAPQQIGYAQPQPGYAEPQIGYAEPQQAYLAQPVQGFMQPVQGSVVQGSVVQGSVVQASVVQDSAVRY
ncbi:hypothetical protein M885DRAFT_504419 [Pelagophyceae sp. CCMP2097]|nr:hypothetical protein M885DRAFT_504419 [Pelagophyceae sp. CCMP2097]